MSIKEIGFSLKYFLRNILSRKLISSILGSFGSLWLIVEICTYFLSDTSPVVNTIKDHWYIFVIIGFFFSVINTKPKFSFSSKLNSRDISIEITIGNIFKQKGALVISSNTTFDTHISNDLISEISTQGQFTKLLYYGNEAQLDKDISFGLQDIQPETLIGERIGKNKKYPISTIVKLNPKNKTVYMIAMANINEHGVASGSFDELKTALGYLWLFIGKRGLKESIAIPVIGSGPTRLTQTREEIIRETIKSFIVACSESTFCDKLTVVINPIDVEKYKIDLNELEKFISHVCRYTIFSNNTEQNGQQV
jgi:hypothetical protein